MTVKKPFVQKFGDTYKEAMVSEPLSKEEVMVAEVMVAEIIRLLKEYGEVSIREISDSMGYKSSSSSLRKVVRIQRAASVVEFTEPDSPRSPTQRIRLGRMYEH